MRRLILARVAIGTVLLFAAIAFVLACIIQGLQGTDRDPVDKTFYWHWVFTFTGIAAAIVAVVILAGWLIFHEGEDGS